MARVYGLEALRMADADVLPYDYEDYGKEILVYLDAAKNKAQDRFGDKAPDFARGRCEALAIWRRRARKCFRSSEKYPLTPERSMPAFARPSGRC